MSDPIVLFDGDCAFCNRIVQFIIAKDPNGLYRFAPLKSKVGVELLERCGLKGEDIPAKGESDTFVLVEGERCFIRSTAALRLCRNLSGLWPLMYVFILVPRPLRDVLYTLVANNRYRLIASKDSSCVLVTPEVRERFLE